MKILIIGDPLASLRYSFDGSLFLARAFQKLKHRVFWTTPQDLVWTNLDVLVRAVEMKSFERGERPEGSLHELELSSFGLILIRPDPPFDHHYLRLCWILAPFEKKIHFVNRPSLLARYHEKMLPYEAYHQGFLKKADLNSMGLAQTATGVKAYLASNESNWFVRKPWLGYAGHRVEKLSREQVADWEPQSTEPDSILQPFDETVMVSGDRRVFFLNGKHIGDFARMPKPGGFISNTAQGGTYKLSPLSAKELSLIKKVEKFLRKIGIAFAGADFIGGRLNEVNITSPTGFAPYLELTGKDLSPLCAKEFLKYV